MYKLCKTEQSALRQRELEQGLLKAMMKQRFDEISVSDLCDDLNVPRKSFYRYFASKEGALFALLDHTLLKFYDATGPDRYSKGTALGDLDRFFRFWFAHKDLIEALQNSQLSGLLVQRATMLAEKEQLMPGYIKNWTAKAQHMAISFAVCGLLSMVFQWHQEGYLWSADDMAQMATTLLSKPLVP